MKRVFIAAAIGALTIALSFSFSRLHRANGYIQTLSTRLEGIKPAIGHEHADIRQWMIRQELSRVGPIVVLGDSLTEAAPLPGSVCGRPVVNAGVGGATAKFGVDNVQSLLGNVSPALIVIALGTNDAIPLPNRAAAFAGAYADLLTLTSRITARIAIVTIPSIDPKGDVARGGGFDARLVTPLNDELTNLAARFGAELIDVRAAIDHANLAQSTIDGVHLSNRAYDIWMATIEGGIRKAMGCANLTPAAALTAAN